MQRQADTKNQALGKGGSDPYKELHRREMNAANPEAYPLQRARSHDYVDINDKASSPTNTIVPAVIIPTEIFNPEVTTAIGHYIHEFIYPNTRLAAGKYVNNLYGMTFTLDHDVVFFGELDATVVNNASTPLLQCLLQEAHENMYFAAGNHIIAQRDSSGAITNYHLFIAQHDIAVRKDKYGNMVCDIINNKHCLGSGGYGGVFPVLGTVKPRIHAPNGLQFEAGNDRRLFKVVENKKYERHVFCNNAQQEEALTKRCDHLASRHSIFGISSKNQLLYGMSIRKIDGSDLYDYIQADTWKIDSINYDEYFQVSIELFEKLKQQVHDKGIIHRDLKPENILIRKDASGCHLDIIDLGCAKFKTDADTTNPGTHLYAAPERFLYSTAYEASDIYSMALIVGLLWRDKNQRHVTKLSVTAFILAREACDWRINFDLFKDMPGLPYSCKSMLMNFLFSATEFEPHKRPSIDECIKTLRNIYHTYKEHQHSFKDNGKNIHSAKSAAEKAARVLTSYGKISISEESANAWRAELKTTIDTLPDTNIAVFEFMGTLGLNCFTGCRSKAMLLAKIDQIVADYFSVYKMISTMQSDMNDMFMKAIAAGLKEDDQHAIRVFKEINQLSAFRSKRLECTLNLDTMFSETEHMRRKYRKSLHLKKHLIKLTAEVSEQNKATTSLKPK